MRELNNRIEIGNFVIYNIDYVNNVRLLSRIYHELNSDCELKMFIRNLTTEHDFMSIIIKV